MKTKENVTYLPGVKELFMFSISFLFVSFFSMNAASNGHSAYSVTVARYSGKHCSDSRTISFFPSLS